MVCSSFFYVSNCECLSYFYFISVCPLSLRQSTDLTSVPWHFLRYRIFCLLTGLFECSANLSCLLQAPFFTGKPSDKGDILGNGEVITVI